jgi:hypothetical protein
MSKKLFLMSLMLLAFNVQKLPDLNGVSLNVHFSLNDLRYFLLRIDSLDFLIS